MKVLLCCASKGEGGLEKHLVELSHILVELGVEVHFAGDPSFSAQLDVRVSVHPWNIERSRWNPLLYRQLRQIIRQVGPAIVHAQANKAGAVLAKLKPGLGSIKTLVTIHNKKRNLKFVRPLDAVIGVSDFVTRQVDHPWAVRIYNGIRPPALSAKVPERGDHLLAVGRLVPAKGFDNLIRALNGTPYPIKIAGDGPDLALLKQLVVDQKLEDRVEFLGHRTDIDQLMREAKGVVIPSRREGFSYVFAEALLNKTPVIACNVPVANEILPGDLMCEPDNLPQLHELLLRFNPQDSRYEALFRQAQALFTLESMGQQTRDLYRQLVEAT